MIPVSDGLYYLCVTCGRLKHEDLYAEEGNCTYDDCHEADRDDVNFREAPDGDGFVSTKDERNGQSRNTGTDQSGGGSR